MTWHPIPEPLASFLKWLNWVELARKWDADKKLPKDGKNG